MPRHRYINKNVLFDDEWDEKTTKYDVYGRHKRMETIAEELRKKEMLDRKEAALKRTLASTERALGILHEAEDIGITSAQELSRQHDVLMSANHKLGQLKADLRVNQRRINSIKSIFDTIANYFTGKQKPMIKDVNKKPDRTKKKSKNILETSKPSEHKPTLNVAAQPKEDHKDDDVGVKINANLEGMLNTVIRLKEIGNALGEEIEDQNSLLDVIQAKVDDSKTKILSQNNQLQKLM